LALKARVPDHTFFFVFVRTTSAMSAELEGEITFAEPPSEEACREQLREAYKILKEAVEGKDRGREAAILLDIASARLRLGYAVEAANAARESFAIYRELGDVDGKQSALDSMCEMYIAALQVPQGVEAVKREKVIAKDTGDKVGELALLRAMTNLYGLLGRSQDALSTALETAALAKELKDTEAAELLVVAGLQRTAGNPTVALQAAQQSISAASKAGDSATEEQARRLASSICVERGQAQAAPNRAAAMEAIRELAAAVRAQRADLFKVAVQRLEDLSGFDESDVQEALAPALEEDEEGTERFLRLVGFDTSTGKHRLKEIFKKSLYLDYRMTGLWYGPRFRNCRPNKIMRPNSLIPEACAVVHAWDEQEDWCDALAYHPGIIDSMQHTSTALHQPM